MEKAILTEERAELTVSRTFNAPRERVWKAYTEPELLKRWWGPKGFTAPVIKNDFHVGGRYLYGMRSPEGQDFWSTGTYREIVPMERIVATDSFSDAEGNIVPASDYGFSGDWPLELPVTVTFEEHDGRTTVTIRETGMPVGEHLEQAGSGWNESLDKLASMLEGEAAAMGKMHFIAEAGKQETVITRIFDAPRKRVFEACTDPKLMSQWWGPGNITNTIEKMDVRPGGIWRVVQRDAEGNEFAFHGVYHDVTPPERLVFTFEFEGEPGRVLLETETFEEVNGRTKMTDRAVFQTVEDRDLALSSGMEEGAVDSMNRLAELVEREKP